MSLKVWLLVVAVLFVASAFADVDLESITTTEKLIDGAVEDIQWIGPSEKEKKTLFVRTVKNTIYRSKNEGRKWENLTEKLEGSEEIQPGGRGSGVVDIIPNPVDHLKVFFLGVGKKHWATHDGGESYQLIDAGIDLHEVRFHPTKPDWALGSEMTAKCFKKTAKGGPCNTQVYLTKDFGKTWKMINNYVVQFGWGHAGTRGVPAETVYMTAFRVKAKAQKYGYWDPNVDFVRSSNLGEKYETLMPSGNRFLNMGKYMFIAVSSPAGGLQSSVTLQISADEGQSFQTANLPKATILTEHSYTVVDASDDTVFLHVNHGTFSTLWGHIYVSDASGVNYSLSLKDSVRDKDGRVDFEKILGLEGIYMANFVSNAGRLDDDSPSSKRVLQSAITFDKGGEWHKLMAPKTPNSAKCSGNKCPTLHLHGLTDEWGPFYSADNSIGVIMATGNVGKRLLSRADEVNTYLSRDAGLTWDEVKKGSHIYEYGDHGALVVMADNVKATSKLIFSWNEGHTWEEYTFATRGAFEVENIVVEPSSTSQVFLVYGTKGESEEGILAFVDFSGLHQRACVGRDAPDSDDSDYEVWHPHSDGRLTVHKNECLMGRQVSYVRRKRLSECFNGVRHEHKQFIKNCECIQEDWECDYNYSLDDEKKCSKIDLKYTPDPDAMCSSVGYGQTVKVSNGYRKVSGDSCVGGVDLSGLDHQCSFFNVGGGHFSLGGWFVLFLLIMVVGALSFATFLNKNKAGQLQDCFAGVMNSQYMQRFKYKNLNYQPETMDHDEFGFDEDEDEPEVLHEGSILDRYNDSATANYSSGAQAAAPVLTPPPRATEGQSLLDDFNPRD